MLCYANANANANANADADADVNLDADADAFKVGGKTFRRSWGKAVLAKRGLGQSGAVINV